jgi:hypothetical protein
LPLYNRNFLVLGLLTPNTHDVEGGSELAGASFSVAGNRPNENSFLLDGSDNVASGSNQSLPFQVNDSVQEFRVISSAASAEYGRGQGGVVNVVTRRGGNALHGNVFGYFGSDRLNADNPLSVYKGTTFDKAADRAGPVSATPVPTVGSFFGGPPQQGGVPQNYNEYVATAQAQGVCTNSMSATNFAGSSPCVQYDFPGFPVANGFGLNTRFDPATILAANDKRKQPFDSKQFGANLGGALVKDKLFAFVSYEGTLINNPNQIFERVPSTYDKTYNPNLLLPSGAARPDAVPLAGAYNFGPADPNYALDRSILGLFPTANVVGVPGVLEFFRGQAPNSTHVHNGLARFDYVYSDASSWTFRYAVQGLSQLHDDTLPEQPTYPGNGANRGALNQNLSIGFSHTFSPSLINELRFGVSRFNLKETAQDSSFDATTLGVAGFNYPKSQMPTILLNGLDTQSSGATPFNLTTFGALNGAFAGWSDLMSVMEPTLDYLFPMARLGAPLNTPSNRRDTTWSIADNVSWSRGKHAVKFGLEFRDLENRVGNGAWSRGFIYSSNIGQFTSDSETCGEGCGFGGTGNNFRAPSFDFAQRQAEAYSGQFHSYAFSGYVQDTWRFAPRWTLNYGLRYDYFSVPTERNDRIWNFDPVANGLVQQGRAAVQDPYGNSCPGSFPYDSFSAYVSPLISLFPWTCKPVGSGKIGKSDKNNFAPRIGMAWDVFGSGKTVLRAGFGTYYDQLPINLTSQLMLNRPTSLSNANGLLGTAVDLAGSGICPNFFGACGLGSSIVNPAVQASTSFDGVNSFSFYGASAQPFGVYARDVAHSSTPYSWQINASWQQQINNKLTFELGYVGTEGRHLPVLYNSNFGVEFNTFSSTGGQFSTAPVMTITNRGESSYHSLMARVRAADWHGFRVNATYVWSKSIDNASTSIFPTLPNTLQNLGFGYQFAGTGNPSAACILGINFFGSPCTITNFLTTVAVNPFFPTIDLSTGAVTTTGAGQVLTSRYLIPQNPLNFLVNDRGRSDFDNKHRMVLDYTWEVPGPKSSVLKGNWVLSGIFDAQSGQPFTIFAGPAGGEVTQRVNVLNSVAISNNPNSAISTANLQLPSTVAPCVRTVLTGSPPITPVQIPDIIQPATGLPCTGNSGRNAFTGPNFIAMDFAIQKGFTLGGESRMLSFRAEFYNLFNRSNFYNPISQLSTDGFTPNPSFGLIKSAHDPRQIQFGVRYSW